MSLLNKLSDSLLSTTGRTRDRAFLDAAMAASALVATADGDVSFAQRSRLDDLLASVEPLKAYDVHDGPICSESLPRISWHIRKKGAPGR